MPVDFEKLAKTSVKRLAKIKFHRGHAKEAKEVLRTLERLHGKISPAVRKQIDSYAQDVFGSAMIYAPWLRVYAAVNGSFKEGWIPDNYYGAVVVPKTKGWYGKISTLKSASKLIFRDDAFPDLGYFANGFFYTMENAPIPDRDLHSVLFGQTDKVAFKLDESGQGKGVFVIDNKSFDPQFIRSSGNGVFQSFIRQHEVFDHFTQGPVATLRFTTVVEPAGGISLRACFLRLGRSGETHIQTGSEVCVAIDVATGELCPRGYMTDWTDVVAHPDTHVPFKGVRIPAFAACVAKVLELHAKVPAICCIGWDITVDTEENVKVLEWNAEHNDIKFGEATQGPCFSDLGWEHLRSAHGRS